MSDDRSSDPTTLFVADTESLSDKMSTETGVKIDETFPLRLGRYVVKDRIDAGAFGVVYRGDDPDLQREVAIKVPRSECMTSSAMVELYLNEARTAAGLDNPAIVPVYDCGQTDDGRPFVVSKFISGQNLQKTMRARRFSVAQSAALIAGIAEALYYAHSTGIVHRDIKPANILLDEAGRAMLADFGMALRPDGYAQGTKLCGTVSYMSPEQAGGRADKVDGRSDIYSLGVVLYELLTGQRPYRGQDADSILAEIADESAEVRPPRQIDASLPHEMERICLKALAKRPAERYTTAADLAADLRKFIASPETESKPRVPLHWLSVAVLIIGILGVVVAMLFFRGANESAASNVSAPVVVPALQQPVRVESVEIRQLVLNSQNEHEDRGFVLKDHYRLHEGDAVQFRAQLSRPAYCFWLAFRPDGVEELCFPQDANEPPPLTDQPTYPVSDPEGTVYGLTDGAGMQAFALVVSEHPLPSYKAWCVSRGTCPWRPTALGESVAIHHHDGHWDESFPIESRNQTRGAGERRQGGRRELEALVAWLRNEKPSAVIEAWALPVLPRSKD